MLYVIDYLHSFSLPLMYCFMTLSNSVTAVSVSVLFNMELEGEGLS